MEKIVKIKYTDGTEHDHKVLKFSVTQRNALFKEYLNLNKFMNSNDEKDISEYVKDDKSVLDFMTETLKRGIENYDPDKVTGKENDKLFADNFNYIVDMGDDLGN